MDRWATGVPEAAGVKERPCRKSFMRLRLDTHERGLEGPLFCRSMSVEGWHIRKRKVKFSWGGAHYEIGDTRGRTAQIRENTGDRSTQGSLI